MRTIRTKVYKFDELTKEAKQRVIDEQYDINLFYGWWQSDYDDANEIGLEITEFDIDRNSISGNFITSAGEVVEAILSKHGETCGTYQTALSYKNCFQHTSNEVNEDELENDEDDFLKDILADYIKIIKEDFEYLTTEPAIIETIEANEYEFLSNGKMI